MNKAETIQAFVMIKTAYPKYFVSTNPKEAELQVNVWQDLLKDDPYEIVVQAIKALMCTLKFPPTIADVKEKIALITQPEQLSEMEAWSKVLRAVQNSSYFASEEFNKLPQVIQRIIGSPNQLVIWGQMDLETVNSVIQSNFMRSYKSTAERERVYNGLPQSTKAMINDLKQNTELDIKRIITIGEGD